MARDEEGDDERPRRGKRSFWQAKSILVFFSLFFVFVAGILIEHFYLEPLLAPQNFEQLKLCKAENALLQQENADCLSQLYGGSPVIVPSDENNPG